MADHMEVYMTVKEKIYKRVNCLCHYVEIELILMMLNDGMNDTEQACEFTHHTLFTEVLSFSLQ